MPSTIPDDLLETEARGTSRHTKATEKVTQSKRNPSSSPSLVHKARAKNL